MSSRRVRRFEPQESDLDLALAGDRGAWSRLVRAHTALVFGTALRVGVSREDAQDVTQAVWTALATRGHAVRDARALPAWLVTTTRRIALRMRRRARSPELEEISAELPSGVPPIDELLTRAEELERVRGALGALPRRCRELLLALFENRKPEYRRITETLGLPRGSIGPTRARCLAELHRLITDEGGDTR